MPAIKSIMLITFTDDSQVVVPVAAEEPDRNWINVSEPEAFMSDFSYIRMEIKREDGGPMFMFDISRASGCLGYALSSLCGERLSDPDVVSNTEDSTVLEFFWDSTKSQRDDPDFDDAFGNARNYVANGSPIRTTNRAGAGTKGTPLVEGIGPCSVRFWVA